MNTSKLVAPRARRHGAIIRWAALALALNLLAGCNLVSLGYNRLPTWLYWQVDRLVDLHPAQSEPVRRDLDVLHQWHRQQQLPHLADMLKSWQTLAEGPLTAEVICRQYDDLRDRLGELVQQAAPVLASLALSLDASQLQHLRQQHAKENERFAGRHLSSPQASLDLRWREAIDRAERLYGTLTTAQRNALRQQLQDAPFAPDRVLSLRLHRQQRMRETIEHIQAGAIGEQAIAALWRYSQDRVTTVHGAYAHDLALDACTRLAELHNSSTPLQRQQAIRTLRNWESDLRRLASQ